MFVFTEPIRHGSWPGRPADKTRPRARASIGSPTGVPVPWASTYWIDAGRNAGVAARLAQQVLLRLLAGHRHARVCGRPGSPRSRG